MYNWLVIHGIKRKPHLSVVWNWYHFVAIAILHQPRPTDSADISMRLQLSDTSSIPSMHGGFLLVPSCSGTLHVCWYTYIIKTVADVLVPNKQQAISNHHAELIVLSQAGLEIPSSPIANAMRNGEGLQLCHISYNFCDFFAIFIRRATRF